MTQENYSARLASIDVLRGFDMFFLVGAGDILRRFFEALHMKETFIYQQLLHVDWIGFTAWDIIMPLFLFTSGLSMPFSFDKFMKQGHSKPQLYGKILKRFLILFVLGWIAQGNLLDLSLDTFHVYCNTLHSIAFGYLITALIILNVPKLQLQVVVGALLVFTYWTLLTFVPVPGFGSGVFTPEGNLAIYIDHALLGKFDDGTQYTWILSSLGFGATVFSGYYAGRILKQDSGTIQKLKKLLIIGVALIAGGLLWSFQMPIIKKIWSCSMILLSSGICYLLLAGSYFLTDIKRINSWWVGVLREFGMNSIVAYMLYESFRLDKVAEYLLHGLQQFSEAFFPFWLAVGQFAILYLIIRHLYKYKIFLKV